MNPCEEYELLLSARLDGALSLKEETQLHAHLAQCPHCRQLAQELEDLAHPKRLYALIQGLVQLDEDTRNHILHTLKKLLRAAAGVLREDRSSPDL